MGTAAGVAKSCFSSLSRRYSDAYSVAEGTVKVGRPLQRSSRITAIAMSVVWVFYNVFRSYHWELDFSLLILLGGLLVAGIAGSSEYIIGTFLAAQGQFMSAMLDTAINTSPHLQDSEKASIMML